MKNRRKHLRIIHVNGEEWKYYVSPNSVVIFSPDKKRYSVDMDEFKDAISDSSVVHNIAPSYVVKYIEENIKDNGNA